MEEGGGEKEKGEEREEGLKDRRRGEENGGRRGGEKEKGEERE